MTDAPQTRLARLRAAVNHVHFNRFRFWFQLAAFVLLVYGGFAAIDLGNSLPAFNCGYNQQGRAGVCYLLPLQHQLSRPWAVLVTWAFMSIATGFVFFVLWFVVLNKGWCGFICPLGTLQDWITLLRQRLGWRASGYREQQFKTLSWVKYVLLALTLLIPLAIGGGLLSHNWGAPFCQVCPGRMILPLFAGDFSQWQIDFSSPGAIVLTTLGMAFTGLFLVGSFVKKRFFCFFCPMLALQHLVSKPALLKLKKDGSKCTRCGDCYTACDMEIRPIADDVTTVQIMTDDCTLCLKCVASCPENGALRLDFARITIFESTEQGFVRRMRKGLPPGNAPENTP